MGPSVLSTAVATQGSSAIRAYAHCAAAAGGVTVLLMNLHPTAVGNITLPPQFNDETSSRHRYTLQPSPTPSTMLNATGLLGTGIVLNGKLLEVGSDGKDTCFLLFVCLVNSRERWWWCSVSSQYGMSHTDESC